MDKIYYVQLMDGDCNEPGFPMPIGFFTTLEKANEAAKKYAESEFKEGFEMQKSDDGRMEYYGERDYIRTDIFNLDEYLILL